MKTAIYPGSFDPITLGHLNIIRRASGIFERVVVCIMKNAGKHSPMFTREERVEMAKLVTQRYPNVEVTTFDGLIAEYARTFPEGAVIVKGPRANTDQQEDQPRSRHHVPHRDAEVHLPQLVRGQGARELRRGLESLRPLRDHRRRHAARRKKQPVNPSSL